jgi:hypothetical protein
MACFRAIQLLENDLSDHKIDALKRPGGYFTEAGVGMDYGVHLPLIAFDGEHFYIPSLDIERTLKYKNISGGNYKVALIIDDVGTVDPFEPRGIKVHGNAQIIKRTNQSRMVGPVLYAIKFLQ